MKKTKNILVCPLDWGLGHATRMVPIIEMLLAKGVKVFIAADNSPMDFLVKRFSNCDFIVLPGFKPKYPKGKNMALAMALQYPAMLKSAGKAKQLLDEIVIKHDIDIIISDNRYELHHEKVYSVFMTHQLNIQTRGLQKLINPFIVNNINKYIKNYSELWIPDFERDPNLSASLSHKAKFPITNKFFIGPLSRFRNYKVENLPKKYDVMAILSGPEPQRSIFENKLEEQLQSSNLKSIILSAKPKSTKIEENNNLLKVAHLPDDEFAKTIMESEIIISRPGYSTLMDLVHFGKEAIFIPTPGQTEQEYLANILKNNQNYYSQAQSSLNIKSALSESKKYKPIKLQNDYKVLEDRIDFLIRK